jgi:hypothetical protein
MTKQATNQDLDVAGAEPHPKGAAVFVQLDAEETATGDHRSAARMFKPGERYQLLHVISRWRGGEIRGYVLHAGVAHLRHPASPLEYDVIDRAVEAALGVRVVDDAAAKLPLLALLLREREA